MTPYGPARQAGQRGLTIIELVVAVGLFAAFILLIDAVFLAVNRSAQKAEMAADVQQNSRIVVERLTREIRESRVGEVLVGGAAGSMAVVFKSARMSGDNSVFCIYVRTDTEPLYDSNCYYWAGAPMPPYATNPPYAFPCNSATGTPCGTYTPIWQQYIGYYTVDVGGGVKELRRVAGDLIWPTQALPSPTILAGGDVIASHVESFDVSFVNGSFSVMLKARGVQYVQGSTVPAQEMRLPGNVLTRN